MIRKRYILIFSLLIISCFLFQKIHPVRSIDAYFEQIAKTYFTPNWKKNKLDKPSIWEQKFGYANYNFLEAAQATKLEEEVIRILKMKEDLKRLQEFKPNNLSPSNRLAYETLHYYFEQEIAAEKWLNHQYPISPLSGIQNKSRQLMKYNTAFETASDAEAYLANLAQFSFEPLLQQIETRQKQKIIPPDFVIDMFIEEIETVISKHPSNCVLYDGFLRRLNSADNIAEGKVNKLLNKSNEIIKTQVYAAYDTLLLELQALKKMANSDAGLWRLPNGNAYYEYLLYKYTNTHLSPEKIHETGLAEVKRISEELKIVLDSLGFEKDKSVGEHLAELTRNKIYLYQNTRQQKDDCLANYETLIEQMDNKLREKDLFPYYANKGVRVIPIAKYYEDHAYSAFYVPGPIEEGRPYSGIFRINFRNMEAIPKWGMPTLTYHETIPGHHFQITIAREMDELLDFQKEIRFFPYEEGWALYAEKLVWEYGFYQNDPYGNIGRLQAELFRAARLVIDTGIHRLKWTREESRTYLAQTTGMETSDVNAEIDRYIVRPGQACSYKIGMNQFLALRQKMEQALGNQYHIKTFHDVVLKNGALPLPLLEKTVNQYIEKHTKEKG